MTIGTRRACLASCSSRRCAEPNTSATSSGNDNASPNSASIKNPCQTCATPATAADPSTAASSGSEHAGMFKPKKVASAAEPRTVESRERLRPTVRINQLALPTR